MVSILLADDNTATRSALVLLIFTRLKVSDIGTAADWSRLLDLAHSEPPRIILLDWELPGCLPAEGLAKLRALLPHGRIIAMSTRPEARQAALQCGADAFIAKTDPPDQTLAVIRRFVEGSPSHVR